MLWLTVFASFIFLNQVRTQFSIQGLDNESDEPEEIERNSGDGHITQVATQEPEIDAVNEPSRRLMQRNNSNGKKPNKLLTTNKENMEHPNLQEQNTPVDQSEELNLPESVEVARSGKLETTDHCRRSHTDDDVRQHNKDMDYRNLGRSGAGVEYVDVEEGGNPENQKYPLEVDHVRRTLPKEINMIIKDRYLDMEPVVSARMGAHLSVPAMLQRQTIITKHVPFNNQYIPQSQQFLQPFVNNPISAMSKPLSIVSQNYLPLGMIGK